MNFRAWAHTSVACRKARARTRLAHRKAQMRAPLAGRKAATRSLLISAKVALMVLLITLSNLSARALAGDLPSQPATKTVALQSYRLALRSYGLAHAYQSVNQALVARAEQVTG